MPSLNPSASKQPSHFTFGRTDAAFTLLHLLPLVSHMIARFAAFARFTAPPIPQYPPSPFPLAPASTTISRLPPHILILILFIIFALSTSLFASNLLA